MGSILGGGSKGSGKAINTASTNVANTAQEGGKATSQAITNASQLSANSIGQGAQTSANAQWQGAQTAAEGGWQGAQTQADFQNQAIQYLRQADALPDELRTSALRSLQGLYLGNGSITDRAMASPFYSAAVQQGENAVLRNSAATGGLRSGTASENLAQVNQNALLSAYTDQVQGLQGLSSLSSNANAIAQGYANYGAILGQGQANYGNTLGQGQINYGNTLGQGQVTSAQTLAQGQISAADAIANSNNAAAQAVSQGQIAAAQNSAQGSQNSANNAMGLVGLGMTAASFFSDRRLKDNIEFVGMENGHKKYRWDWNDLASKFGLSGEGYGVMADEVDPTAVSLRDGYMVVDYSKLGVSHGL